MKIGVHITETFFDSLGCRLSHPAYFSLQLEEIIIVGANVLVQTRMICAQIDSSFSIQRSGMVINKLKAVSFHNLNQ